MPITNRVDQREAAQREAIDAVLRALEPPTRAHAPEGGLRTQVIMATGSGKTRVAIHSAEKLHASRVLVLVPSLDLLAQTEAAWREGGRRGPMIGISSLRGEEVPFPNTTDVHELVEWTRSLDKVTVYATYASLGLGTLEKAHNAGLSAWDLIVVDEAHRTSGRIGKPWAVIHDNTRIPALRRLYMTATPRMWQLGDEEQAGSPGELVASMDDDPDGPFGSRCFTLTLAEAIDRGICAPYQVVCVDITDPQLQAAQLLGAEARSEEIRGARLAALQTALVKASSEEDFRRTLVFHHVVKEAEAFAAGLPDVTAQLNDTDPKLYPATIWADWLCGEHRPLHRRRVLAEFADGTATDGTAVEKAYLSSVKVLGEGVDTRTCDSVYWADVRGSMPDLVQALGRALRMQPDEGKVASLVVPILLGPGETADNMLTSRAYDGLAKLLEALRAHDARIVETLAEQQAPSRYKPVSERGSSKNGNGSGSGSGSVSAPAKTLLKFSTPRDPAALAAFINLRILNPEHEHWRRGVEATVIYARTHGNLRVPSTFRVPDADNTKASGWPASLANFPLGQWTADARKRYTRGHMNAERVTQLEKLGMIWSHHDVAWEEGLAAARGWAAEHGHLLAPRDATYQGTAVGIWLKNARVAARRTAENEQRHSEGLPLQPSAWTMTQDRRKQLEDIDPSWCPDWPVTWQRCFHLVRLHLNTGQALPTAASKVMRQGEDLSRWVTSVRRGWSQLTNVQQWMCTQILGITPATENKKPKPRTSQANKWAMHYEAATQFFEREGHLAVPRKHIETITIGGDSEDQKQQDVALKLGAWIANQRARAATLAPERVEQLSKAGMRWA
ncbi:Helicase associated domain protein (plasmid) [Streptomyces sp. NBC_00536]|uniref:DEAD/DEAH box helicase n=1 Tax=Streptomyces sp. NBC_00536 TaxID=2975769 RepID=UPI002E8078A1|nr:Helicase associated domain protein [Streptomyces sp. NBC_00536]WUC76877.1 Helicase associated domain protein [Streptomyces sp. NBC_00536]WUC83520.1 Helicase associated domain protein [Streptomyces sp. NBC_00536]WUC84068.1 Helicase associated domain protein [Streptomyces sp. NBC_00536]